MKKTALLTAVLITGLLISSPYSNARGRQNTGNTSTATNVRPGTPNNNASQRPPTPNVRPTTPAPPSKPGFNPGIPPSNKPGGNMPAPVPPRPSGPFNPGYSYRPPMPHTPPSFNYYRPTPPPSWMPAKPLSFGRILGIALGSVISNSINSLYNSGYNIAGYTNNEVFLNNVNYCNVSWPNVTMYYNNGYLQGSLFSASSYTYDPSRYNYVYSYLTSHYGMPVTSQSISNGGMSCTWWGSNNTFLTLSFYPEVTFGGTRYFTTLSTGY